jgi:hypothetical protein
MLAQSIQCGSTSEIIKEELLDFLYTYSFAFQLKNVFSLVNPCGVVVKSSCGTHKYDFA